MAKTPETTQAHCNRCLGQRKHYVLATRVQSSEEIEEGQIRYWEKSKYDMLECCGCENITLRVTYDWIGEPETSITYYPPAVTRQRPRWMKPLSGLTLNLYWLFDEVYAALHAGSNRLAIMGARTLIDMVMLDKIGDQGSFRDKLKKMESEGYLSKKNTDYLFTAIDAGSAAAHRGHRPSDDDVNRVIDIVENLVEATYFLGRAAQKIQKNTPPRAPKT